MSTDSKPKNRYKFTREDCQKGYQAAWKSLETRYPGCDPHFLLCAIMGSKSLREFLPDTTGVAGLTDEQIAGRYCRES